MKKRIEIVISIDEASIDDDNITIEEKDNEAIAYNLWKTLESEFILKGIEKVESVDVYDI